MHEIRLGLLSLFKSEVRPGLPTFFLLLDFIYVELKEECEIEATDAETRGILHFKFLEDPGRLGRAFFLSLPSSYSLAAIRATTPRNFVWRTIFFGKNGRFHLCHPSGNL